MIKSRAASLILVSLILLSAHLTNAQVITDKAVLQRASQLKAAQEADMHRIVLSLAAEKGWPLTIKTRKGRMAYLRSVGPTGEPIYVITTDNVISAATIQTNTLWAGGSTGLNLSGGSSNMAGRLGLWDEGRVRTTHVELTGRVTQVDGNTNLSDHSTHVAGTMVAAGVNPVAKGMSYGAQLKAYDFDNDESEMYNAAQNGLLVSNHSYAVIAGWYYNTDQTRWEFWGRSTDTSDYKFGYYDDDARVWDSISYYAPNYLIAKASGNNRSENGPAVGQTYWRYNANNVMSNAGNRPAGISSNNGYGIIATYGCS
ncbi:MAG TPA: S8 family serine peptidase, partial [Puia sp.]